MHVFFGKFLLGQVIATPGVMLEIGRALACFDFQVDEKRNGQNPLYIV
jgi:hypothetical protein